MTQVQTARPGAADMAFTIVGAGSRVLGVGLADDVLVYLVPLILIVTSGQRERKGGWGGGDGGWRGEDSWLRLLRMHPLAGPDGGDQDRARARGLHKQHVSQGRFSSWRKKKKKKVAAGGGAIKQHISPNAQLAKQT